MAEPNLLVPSKDYMFDTDTPQVDDLPLDDDSPIDDEPIEEPSDEPEGSGDLRELIQRVEAIERLAQRVSEIDQIKGMVGRVSALQSAVDKLGARSGDPRVDELQETLEVIADDMGEMLSDEAKRKLATRRAKRDRDALAAEIRNEIQSSSAPANEPTEDEARPWIEATRALVNEMQKRGIDPQDSRIKWRDPENPDPDPISGSLRILRLLDQIEKEDAAPVRLAQRKQSAGKSAPPSAGPSRTAEDVIRDRNASLETRLKALAELTS